MKQNAADRALATLTAQIAVLEQARDALTAAMNMPTTAVPPSSDRPTRGRPRRKGLPDAE